MIYPTKPGLREQELAGVPPNQVIVDWHTARHGGIGKMMSADDSKAQRIRKQAERITARDERARDAAKAVIDEEKRRMATATKTVRLREQRLVREAASARPALAKKVRRLSGIPADRLGAGETEARMSSSVRSPHGRCYANSGAFRFDR
jgi:hypothetical protein